MSTKKPGRKYSHLSCSNLSSSLRPIMFYTSAKKPGGNFFSKQLRLLNRRITKLERELGYEGTYTLKPCKLSLKQLTRRVERLEKKVQKTRPKPPLPSTKSCLKFLIPEAKHWYSIGILLAIPEPTLEQIEDNYLGDCRACVREMIRNWLKQVNPPPSWKNLADAVELFNPGLAKKILSDTVDTTKW